jgi:hypothetical protein
MTRSEANGIAALLIAALALPAVAWADAEQLSSLPAVHRACDSARQTPRPRLYDLEVEYRLGIYHEESGRLLVDTRRNLSAIDGRVSVLISGLERVGFDIDPAQAEALREAARAGAHLHLGFFLGFDDPRRPACLVRGASGVTIVRADLAYVELVASGGERVARAESDRLRSWLDDQSAFEIPGDGPRGAVGTASFDNAQPPPEAWQRAIGAAAVRARLAQCHAEGVARGVPGEGQVVVRLNIESRTGRVRRADVAISSLGDDAEAECIARAVGGSQLAPGPAGWPEAVDLSVPVRVTAD